MSGAAGSPTSPADYEARYRALFETMGPAVLLMRGAECIDCNPATLALFGLERREDILGRTPLDFAPELQPNGRPSAELVQQNVVLALQRGTHTFEWEARRRGGEPFLMEVRFTPCGPPAEGLFLCIAVDIGESRLTEAERLRTQKLEALGTLAGGIAHDFNNLLQRVSTGLGAARVSPTLEEAKTVLLEVEDAVQMAARLTAQLLTFARGGAPVRGPVAVAPLVARTLRLVLSGSPVASELALAADLLPVETDEGQLEQVLHNLLRNAVQAMPAGGRVRVSGQNVPRAELPPRATTSGPFVAITVEDSGVGIPPEQLGRIFDPYFTTRPGGNGLGLSTAYSVVHRHGGFIDVKSVVGQGSRFTVYLPASTSVPPTPPARTPAPGQRRRLLWMDDEPRLRTVTEKLLSLVGHQVVVAADGAEAIEQFVAAKDAGAPFDLVVLDLTVRDGMGGLETLERLRALDASVRAVVCSGYSDDAALSEYRAHGFSGVLRKPCTLAEIEAVIAEVLHA